MKNFNIRCLANGEFGIFVGDVRYNSDTFATARDAAERAAIHAARDALAQCGFVAAEIAVNGVQEMLFDY